MTRVRYTEYVNAESSPTNASTNHETPEGWGAVPMYELSENDYQTVIDGLVDAVLDSIQSLREAGLSTHAERLAVQSRDALLIYDDDVAEFVGMAARENSKSTKSGLGAARETHLL